MCYAIPGKIVRIDGHLATIDYFGEKKNALAEHAIKVGDYVYAQGGVVIDTVPEEEAKKILSFWEKKFFELKKKDEELAQVKKATATSENIFLKIKNGKPISKNEMKILLNAKGTDAEALHSFANVLRKENLKNSCCVHGIIEFSNYCGMNCLYCGIRATKNMQRYRMSEREIVSVAERAVKLGFKALVLQSGEDRFYTKEMLVRIVKRIRKMGVLVFLSLGERDLNTYHALYDAGARAALLRFETSNPHLYAKWRPGRKLEARINLIMELQKIGYLVSTGFLIGLPGESESDLTNNILLTKKLGTDMYSFGPYIPEHKVTPLNDPQLKLGASSKLSKDVGGSGATSNSKQFELHPPTEVGGTRSKVSEEKTDLNLCLNAIALVRLLDKNAKILVTTALETLSPEARKLGLLAGGNSLMIDVTPEKYAKMYNLYEGKFKKTENEIKETISLLYSLGRAPTDLGL